MSQNRDTVRNITGMELGGKITVVTGAAGGIGMALAERFHKEGATVVLADRDQAPLDEIALRLNTQRPNSALAVAGDLGTEEANATLISTAEKAFGPIDLFFANAGVGSGTDLTTEEDVWNTAFDINVNAHRWAASIWCRVGLLAEKDIFAALHLLLAYFRKLAPRLTPSPNMLHAHLPSGFPSLMASAVSGSVACVHKASIPTCSKVATTLQAVKPPMSCGLQV